MTNLCRPYAALYLADMVKLQEQHRQTRLTNAAADSLRHLSAQQRLVPFQLQAIFITGNRKLLPSNLPWSSG